MSWVSHFHSAGAAAAQCPPLRQLLLQLFTLPSRTWIHALFSWVRVQNLIIKASYRDLRSKPNVLGRTLQSFEYARNLLLEASPLYYACFAGSFEVVQHLVDNNGDINKGG